MKKRICLPYDPRPLHWQSPNGWGSFHPTRGTLELHGLPEMFANAARWKSSQAPWTARIIVGFQRGLQEQREELAASSMEALVNLVREVRTEQVNDPGATFLAQRGLYRHKDSGVVVDEPGAAVILINTPDMETSPKAFEAQAVALAERIAAEFEQDEVILELQRNGIVQSTQGIGA